MLKYCRIDFRHIYGAPVKLLRVRGHLTGYFTKCLEFTDVLHKYACLGVCTHLFIFIYLYHTVILKPPYFSTIAV